MGRAFLEYTLMAIAYFEGPDGHWQPVPKPEPLRTLIRGALLNALAYTDGRQKQAAEILGVSPRAIVDIMRSYGVPTAKGQPPKSRQRPSYIPQSSALKDEQMKGLP